MVRTLISTDTRYPVNRKLIKRAVGDVLAKNNVHAAEVSVAVVGERKMRELVKNYLHDDEPCEVLAFPLEDVMSSGQRRQGSVNRQGFVNPPDGVLRLGDLVLCWPQVLLSASRNDKLVDDEVYFLTGHGVLHLLGKHHE